MSFAYEMLKKTSLSCDKHGAKHYCFVCGQAFTIEEGKWCEICNWWKFPCGHCGCSLPLEERVNLERAFHEICGGQCKLNPKKRKKHSSNIIRGVTKEEFLTWAEKNFPNLMARYKRGEITFDKLLTEIEYETELTWVF